MNDFWRRVHRALFGFHNGVLADQYAVAATTLATESRIFREELLAFRQTNDDPLRELIRIQRDRRNGGNS